MAAQRITTSLLLRVSRSSSPSCIRQFKACPVPSRRRAPGTIKQSHLRFYSQEYNSSKIYAFHDVKALLEKPDANRILIDTREPAELQATGTIPGSLNIPVNSQPDSFFITAEEFEDRFGFDRPEKEQEVIFYCKAGVRSRAAAEFAKQAGWANVGEYQGSWLDWEKNGGVKEGGR